MTLTSQTATSLINCCHGKHVTAGEVMVITHINSERRECSL